MRRRALGVALAVAALWACTPEVPRRPHVVLVVLDTLRADHLSCYGYERETSPRIDALCREATVYENAHSASCWTLPAHASLFTGLLPIRHGAHNENRLLADHHETLAELLTAAGYESIAIVSNAMLSADRRLDQGFAEYHETWRDVFDEHPKLFPDFEPDRPPLWKGIEHPLFRAAMQRLRPGVDENSYFLFRETLRTREPGKPLFVFVNLVGIHSPYDSSGPFYGRFLRHPELSIDDDHWPEYYAGRMVFPPEQFEHFVDLYDAEVLHADHVVGRMIDDLRAEGLWDDTLFVVTSDHGESLGEHGHLSHVFALYETLTRIPLVVHYPPLFEAGQRIRTPVHLADVFPTILEAASAAGPVAPLDARPLAREPAGGDESEREILAEYYYPWENVRFLNRMFAGDVPGLAAFERRLRAITRGDMKLIWGSDGRHELYDLSRDPEELHDLIDDPAHAATRDALLDSLERFVLRNGGHTPIPRWDPEHPDRAPGLQPDAELDPETVRELEELGYF